jgi:hypothetical protein
LIKLISIPKISDNRGNLSFVEYPGSLPFKVKRVFWTYDIPGGEKRGGHAYFKQEEIIIALSGSFDVVISDNQGNQTTYSLNRSYFGLYIPALTWRHMENFSTNSLGLHLSSSIFDEKDYLRDFDLFTNLVRETNKRL